MTSTIELGDIPPTYRINLALPPVQRYKDVATRHRNDLIALTGIFDDLVTSIAPNVSLIWVRRLARLLLRRVYSAEETEELRGISLVTGIEMYLIVALNVLLDVLMGCTSGAARAEDADGARRMLHFRTLDWGMDALRRVLVRFEYVRTPDETVLATSISYIGFVGVLTGVRRGLSVSLNFRPNHAGGWLGQLRYYGSQVLVLLGWRRPVSSVLREYLIPKDVLQESCWRRALGWRSMEESQTVKWPALRSICDEILRTPSTAAYIILCDGYKATVIEKDHRIAFSDSSSSFIVATNSDHLTPALESKNEDAKMWFGTALSTGEVITMADFLQDSKERRACMQAHWDEKIVQAKRTARSSKKATAATRHDPLQRTRSSRLHEPKAPIVPSATTSEETIVDTAETIEVTATLDEIIGWTASYPTTNEMTHFATVLDPVEGRVLWIRRFVEPLVFEEDGD